MKKIVIAMTTAFGMSIAATPVLAFSLGDVNKAVSALGGNQQTQQSTQATTTAQQATVLGTTAGNLSQASDLVSTLSDQLGVTQQQAIGGSAAMLALAKSQLGDTQFNQLSNQAPGIDGLLSSASAVSGSSSLLSRISGSSSSSTSGDSSMVNSAFKMLGMDSSMMTQFAPIMLNYFGGNGVSSGLLGSLASVWGSSVPASATE
ncbi:DUF2780 domain-containing protein [Phytohalomonas tamaricis]|uniref:DUF2780 domain-containing protein n=1 Tax=Phytohalomonas tamaricis TaxID=2081032 RepID=UPI001319CFF0|nr:DUF2780 domain-containing protein [Phytohalomonas tamaricis]